MLNLVALIITFCVSLLHTIGYFSGVDSIGISSKESPSFSNALYEEEYGEDEWKLRYFPDELSDSSISSAMFADRADMYNVPSQCDDGKTNISVDWDGSSSEFECHQKFFAVNSSIQPIINNEVIPLAYQAPHYCMNSKIDYSRVFTTFGGHRPVWAKYGEYKFIPRQRWLHNSEHGALIMLYHPCADKNEIQNLRQIVISCLKRHIISPYKLLPPERPLALFTWGWYMSMNSVDPNLVMQFIEEHALHGREEEPADGKYDSHLIKPAAIISDERDSILCPNTIHE